MAQKIDTSSGYANAAKGINTLNAVADVDPRKAVIFDSVAEALENVPLSMRAEGLELKVRAADGTIDIFQFVGGITDAHFKLVIRFLTITISGNKFTYIPIIGNDGSSVVAGDIAKDGWINQNTFGKLLSYKGTGDATLIENWNVIESI